MHENNWTLFDLNEDFYQAVKCFTQFEGEFFQNSVRCDFRGNATFSMAMNKGIPIERNCEDTYDNDGNDMTDCQDPFCKSLAVNCIVHPALDCNWDEAPLTVGQCESIQYDPGDLCCTRQNKLVSGMECKYKSADDGYYDCGCVPNEFFELPTDLGPDCVLPGHTFGDLCCTPQNEVIKAGEPGL